MLMLQILGSFVILCVMYYSDTLSPQSHVVRMAEWSKAPDSRIISFRRSGNSGLRMEAWVQIPLLTYFFDLLFWRFFLLKTDFMILLVITYYNLTHDVSTVVWFNYSPNYLLFINLTNLNHFAWTTWAYIYTHTHTHTQHILVKYIYGLLMLQIWSCILIKQVFYLSEVAPWRQYPILPREDRIPKPYKQKAMKSIFTKEPLGPVNRLHTFFSCSTGTDCPLLWPSKRVARATNKLLFKWVAQCSLLNTHNHVQFNSLRFIPYNTNVPRDNN